MKATPYILAAVLVALMAGCGSDKKDPESSHADDWAEIRHRTLRDDKDHNVQPAIWRVEDADGICYGIHGGRSDAISCIPRPSSCVPDEPRGAPPKKKHKRH